MSSFAQSLVAVKPAVCPTKSGAEGVKAAGGVTVAAVVALSALLF